MRFSQWDGTKWNVVSDYIPTDQALVRPLFTGNYKFLIA